jgi:nucleoside-diphosphate-sugar epimerase
VAVYGLDPPDGADETTPYQLCGNLYCDTKIASEKAVWAAHEKAGLPVVVIRPTNVYGPYSNTWTVRPIKLINSGQMILINGGIGFCNYVYIDNLLDATLAATKRDQSVGQVYLITDGFAVTWKKFFGYYALMAGKHAALLTTCGGGAADNADLMETAFKRLLDYLQGHAAGIYVLDNCSNKPLGLDAAGSDRG